MTSPSELSIRTPSELRARRLIAQLLAPSAARPTPTTLAEVASYLTAIQAQMAPSGRDALALRSGIAPGRITAADLADASIVRSWSQRGTHHYLPLRDVRWVTLLCTPRVQRASEKRRGSLGLSNADVDRCRDAFFAATTVPITRTQAYEIFQGAGVDPEGGRGSHLLRHFGGEGDIVQGTPAGTQDTFIRLDVLNANRPEAMPLNLTGDDALCELGVRYFRSRGPATAQDFAWWSGLTVTDAKRAAALACATGTVIAADNPGHTFFLADWQTDVSATEIAAAVDSHRHDLHLPAFDEYLMAYADRSAIVTPEITAIVGPTKNGLTYPCIVREGEIIGRQEK